MKSLIIGFAVALAAAGGATFLVLQAQPKLTTSQPKVAPTEATRVTETPACQDAGCPTCTIGSTVYDVADLQSIYTKPVNSIETISFEEPPLAPKREVLPAPRAVK